MLNQAVIVGRIIYMEPMFNEIKIQIPRNNKDKETGEYLSDTVAIHLSDNIKENVFKHCATTDLVGVKGSLRTIEGALIVEAEKVTFLQSKNNE